MQLESHATPIGVSPQQRYATLHRLMEQGIVSDDMWDELASISYQLGHHKEAIRCIARICNANQRAEAERNLLEPRNNKTTRNDDLTGSTNPDETPKAKDADWAKHSQTGADNAPGVIDHLVDAGQYLLHQHMPWLVLTTMLAFPLLVGVGGILTTAGAPLLLTAIATLPGIAVLVVVAAMGHEILRSSSDGNGDVPEIPNAYLLMVEARDFLVDGGLVCIVFFGIPATLGIAGASLTTILPTIVIGLFFAPLTFAMRQLRRDLRPFSPIFMIRAIRRSGRGYGWIALVIALAVTPAGVVATTVIQYPIHAQIAIIGPLCVMPTFAISRLLGTWIDTNRASLSDLMQGQIRKASRQPSTTTIQSARLSDPWSKVDRPAACHKVQKPTSTTPYDHGRSRPAIRPSPAFTEKAEDPLEPRPIAGRRADPARATGQWRDAAQASCDKHFKGNTTNPKATVIRGAERKRHGAASRRS